jgi:hypothetical protein
MKYVLWAIYTHFNLRADADGGGMARLDLSSTHLQVRRGMLMVQISTV